MNNKTTLQLNQFFLICHICHVIYLFKIHQIRARAFSGITYAGNHGLEILHPDGSKFVHPMPDMSVDRGERLKDDLRTEVIFCKKTDLLAKIDISKNVMHLIQ